jgi:hypothetical protein
MMLNYQVQVQTRRWNARHRHRLQRHRRKFGNNWSIIKIGNAKAFFQN